MPMSLKALLVLGSQRRYDAPTDPLHFALKALESCVLCPVQYPVKKRALRAPNFIGTSGTVV